MSNHPSAKPQGSSRNRRRRRSGGPKSSGATPAHSAAPKPAAKKKVGLIGKLLGLVGLGGAKGKAPGAPGARKPGTVTRTTVKSAATPKTKAPPRKPESVEVSGPRLYVGNLSYDASEADLREVFNGVGRVQSIEVVTNQRTQRSKGYGFVEMGSTEEARRAVEVLHDQEFMGRKLVVSGAKPRDEEDAA